MDFFRGVLNIIWQFFLFLGFWFLFSGTFDWKHLLYGTLASLFLVTLWRGRSERVVGAVSPQKVWRSVVAVGILLREIWVASWQVAKLVLSPRIDIQPSLVRVTSSLKGDRMRMLYANAITLTPGTLTVQMKGNRLLIHALTKQAADGVVDWSYQNTLKRLEEAK